MMGVYALLSPAFGIGRFTQKIKKRLLGFDAVRVVLSGIVRAEIMVIPGADDGAKVAELSIGWAELLQLVFFPQYRSVGRITVNIIAHPDEQLRLIGEDGLEDRRGFRLMTTRTEDNAR